MNTSKAIRHLASTLDDVQVEALAVALGSTDWTDDLRSQLFDGLMAAGRRVQADQLTELHVGGQGA